jgi:hypothetical protein
MTNIPPPGPLAYEGNVVVPFITKTFAPTSSNYQFQVPSIWVDISTSIIYMLASKAHNIAHWIPIGGSPGSYMWNVVTSASNPITFTDLNGYIPKGASQVEFMLPAGASVGDSYRIIGYGNLWTIGQNAGQTINLGDKVTTSGVGGSVTATMISDCAEIICVTANTEFTIADSIGNLTIV